MPNSPRPSSAKPLSVPGKSAPAEIGSIYERLEFGPIPQGRPYCLIDMVSTLDGKIVVGTRDEPVDDLGSRNDHALLWRLEAQCDAVLVGAHSLRASPAWHFHTDLRFTVTRSGNLDYTQPFFTEGTPVVAGPSAARAKAPPGIAFIESDSDSVDLLELLATMCTDYGVQYLLVLGGSEMNAPLLRLGVIDEIFLTLAPKIKLGRDVPTLAGGEPLERDQLLRYELAETHSIADEVFLRYRRTKR